jgi:hypothetical protein
MISSQDCGPHLAAAEILWQRLDSLGECGSLKRLLSLTELMALLSLLLHEIHQLQLVHPEVSFPSPGEIGAQVTDLEEIEQNQYLIFELCTH